MAYDDVVRDGLVDYEEFYDSSDLDVASRPESHRQINGPLSTDLLPGELVEWGLDECGPYSVELHAVQGRLEYDVNCTTVIY